ncbi:MAG: HAMP domain-containing histidine kinase [Muribaculum sp.]|nr:HAMP domain-containing histidine kinase [Muribaculum sp.]
MEKKIKTLYILSIAAILSFIGMQAYWLYSRYEYSLTEYENKTEASIADAIMEYDKERTHGSATQGDTLRIQRIQSEYNMNHDIDSVGKQIRKITVKSSVINGRKLLGITENRKLTPAEMKRLQELVIDSLDMVEQKMATVDATNAPSDGAAWNAMKNFEREIQSPFTVEGIDSILRLKNLAADISLILQDSVTWQPITIHHTSTFAPTFKVITPYSELEKKAVVIECKIPSSGVLQEMGWTLAMAIVLSLFLILCLVWQIKTIAKLTRLDKMRNSFITTMIHELKRPISTLKMCVSGIDNENLMEDAQLRHELMGETRMALDNLSSYFSKLRDITFNNVEQIPLNLSSFNLKELLDGIVQSIAIPSGKQVQFVVDIPDNIQVSADRSHLMNIMTNLIENAMKYSDDEVTIKINGSNTSEGCFISVEDNGNGISPTDKHRIFNRFYRGKSSSTDIPGMGLGLAYVKLLVGAHGGEIYVESEEGVGSTFNITLPQ